MQTVFIRLAEQFDSTTFVLLLLLFAVCWVGYYIAKINIQWGVQSNRYQMIEKDTHELRGDTAVMRKEMSGLHDESSIMRKDISRLHDESSAMRKDVSGLHDESSAMRKDISGLHDESSAIRKDVSEIRGEMSVMRKDISGLHGDISEIHGDISEIRGEVSGLRGEMSGLRGGISKIHERLDAFLQQKFSDTAVKSSSPAYLTAIGEDISRAIKTDELLEQYGAQLGDIVKENNPVHPYDVQQMCMRAAEFDLPEMMNETQLNAVKTQALKRGLPLGHVLTVVAVPLRDALLKELKMKLDESE